MRIKRKALSARGRRKEILGVGREIEGWESGERKEFGGWRREEERINLKKVRERRCLERLKRQSFFFPKKTRTKIPTGDTACLPEP